MQDLWLLVVGLMVAVSAKLLFPRRDPGNMVTTMSLGVMGSVTAGFVGRAFGWFQGVWEGPGFITASVGAALFIGLYWTFIGPLWRRIQRRRAKKARSAGNAK